MFTEEQNDEPLRRSRDGANQLVARVTPLSRGHWLPTKFTTALPLRHKRANSGCPSLEAPVRWGGGTAMRLLTPQPSRYLRR